MAILILPFGLRFHMVGIVKDNSSLLKGADMVFVGVLIERDQEIRLIPGT